MIIYIVKQGDTIASIAARYGISARRLISDNGLSDLPYLVVGQALIILIPEVVHTVQRGDTVFSIARQYNLTEIELLQKNPTLIYNSVLYPGQKLAIRFQGQEDESIIIYGYVYPYIQAEVLQKALSFSTYTAIFGYGFSTDGTLIPIQDQPIINEAYRYRSVPVFLLTSITEEGTFSTERASLLFNDVNLQNTVIENMLDVMREKGYLAADIDFEFIKPEDGPAFVGFVQNVAEQLHRFGFTVNVDLAPKVSAQQQGLLYEGHNYALLGAAADTVLIMTYEWGYTYGPPMPVAPIENVRKVIDFAITQIPREKILMGIPNYGYDWQLPYEKGTTRAVTIGNEQAVRIAATNGVNISYDETQQSPFFNYFDRQGNKHIVWFEDVRSIQAKFNLIAEYGLRGAGYWNLMKPFAQNWAYLSSRFAIRKLIES